MKTFTRFFTLPENMIRRPALTCRQCRRLLAWSHPWHKQKQVGCVFTLGEHCYSAPVESHAILEDSPWPTATIMARISARWDYLMVIHSVVELARLGRTCLRFSARPTARWGWWYGSCGDIGNSGGNWDDIIIHIRTSAISLTTQDAEYLANIVTHTGWGTVLDTVYSLRGAQNDHDAAKINYDPRHSQSEERTGPLDQSSSPASTHEITTKG